MCQRESWGAPEALTVFMGGVFWGRIWGWSQKIDVGSGPCIRPNYILRSTVIGCEAKYDLTKKGVKEDFFVLKSRFLVKILVQKRVKESYMLYIRFQAVETDKMEFVFLKKVIRKNLGRVIFFRSPNSTPSLHQ